ncbi:SDR family NAD(P)-dependent oxidoreductase [Actinoplanes sp. M2I2]|uniref:SDR family NAD(P)-dependent oxidoreductase n=1 Tax=Actinoplanes sp. M2I2 TaxID=1734444 RepID=UPI0020209771|nr:SDR family NAD(P)-dependent oxidoreductase [Actinoplanes sp. M2I2]
MTSAVQTRVDGRRVLIPGGTGGVGEGIVRAYLAAGAHVVVPSRDERRAAEFRQVLGEAVTDRLHLVVHDYTTFDGADRLAAEMTDRLGGLDDVVAPIGGYWGGRKLWEIDPADWQAAFVDPVTTHAAVMRAVLPRLSPTGTYQIVAGESGFRPVPGSGLLSMEQSALLMMGKVLVAEAAGRPRVFTLVLGPVRTRSVGDAQPEWITPGQIGEVAVAASVSELAGHEIRLPDPASAARALTLLRGGTASRPVFLASPLRPRPGRRGDLLAVLAELAPRIRAEPGNLEYSVRSPLDDENGPLLAVMAFASAEAFERHQASIASEIPRIAALVDGPLTPPIRYDATPSAGGPAEQL